MRRLRNGQVYELKNSAVYCLVVGEADGFLFLTLNNHPDGSELSAPIFLSGATGNRLFLEEEARIILQGARLLDARLGFVNTKATGKPDAA